MPYRLQRIFPTALPALCAVMSVGGSAAALPRRLRSQAPNRPAAAGLEIVVTDPSGALIPNAQVLISSQDGKLIDDGITTAYGVRALDLPPGAYVISVRVPAFADRSQVVIVPKDEFAKVGIVIEIANKFTWVEVGGPHTLILTYPVGLPIFDLYRFDVYRRGRPSSLVSRRHNRLDDPPRTLKGLHHSCLPLTSTLLDPLPKKTSTSQPYVFTHFASPAALPRARR